MAHASADQTLQDIALLRREVAAFRVQRADTLRRIDTAKEEFARRENDLKRELERRIDAHLAPQCLGICNLMQQKMPRELRNMIYAYLLDGSTAPAGACMVNVWDNTLKPDTSHSWHRKLKRFGLLHVCDQDYVGRDTMREIAEAYYRFSTFVFRGRFWIHSVLLVLIDRWGFGLSVSELVRSLQLDLSRDDLRTVPGLLKRQSEALLALGHPLQIILCVQSRIHPDMAKAKKIVADGLRSTFPQLDQPVKVRDTFSMRIGETLSIIVKSQKS